jgi:pyruvate/2-oxoglutarate dehydrogenase complex dihydrolipoamide acyltransferase (E2) component
MDIKIDDRLWASSMLPEGVVERWRVEDGALVAIGAVLAEVRIEDAVHEIIAPAGGQLTILATVNSVIEPGSLLGRLGA